MNDEQLLRYSRQIMLPDVDIDGQEKLLAAHRGGIKIVIIPKDNEADLREIPDNIKSDLNIKPVKWIDEVLAIALQSSPKPLSDEEYRALEKAAQKTTDSNNRLSTH